jgi:raffinose/stachyose/melibiose transport system substrate-binding protein
MIPLRRLSNAAGILLLSGAFAWSSFHVLARRGGLESDSPVIRFAHWQLEGGLREAFDELAKRYMALHPGVRIEQMPVPGKVYPTWLRTAYAGGTMPDLIVLGAASDEDLSVHFRPLTADVLKPNPYNAGTPLEGIPWRETFAGGLAGSNGLNTLQDYYSVPMAELTIRMFVNQRLWREYFGERAPPASFDEFIAVCEDVVRLSRERGERLMPLAGSRFTANALMEPLFQSQTQALWVERNPLKNLNPPGRPAALAFLPGLAGLDMPEIRRGFAIMREVGRFLQPGFLQLDRDEAILLFAEERALMLPTGAWDYGSIVEQARFPVGIFRLPSPIPGQGAYGENVLGPHSEAGVGGATSFHLAARSKHPEIAVDFLKFMTSREGNALFSSISKWPPSVAGIGMPEETAAFAPVTAGYPRGFALAPMIFGSGELYRLQGQALHRLFAHDGGVDAFLDAVRPGFEAAVRTDIQRFLADQERSLKRSDILLAATALGEQPPAGGEAHALEQRRQSMLWQSQHSQETLRYRIGAHLEGRLLPGRQAAPGRENRP